jgi:hypothetical protein
MGIGLAVLGEEGLGFGEVHLWAGLSCGYWGVMEDRPGGGQSWVILPLW